MEQRETERLEIYNLRFPMVAPLLVHERLQWDGVLQRNVWAHPNAVGPALQIALGGTPTTPTREKEE